MQVRLLLAAMRCAVTLTNLKILQNGVLNYADGMQASTRCEQALHYAFLSHSNVSRGWWRKAWKGEPPALKRLEEILLSWRFRSYRVERLAR